MNLYQSLKGFACKKIKSLLLFAAFNCVHFSLAAQSGQFQLEGTAEQIRCDCYSLTSEVRKSVGGAWNAQKLDLSQPFDLSFRLLFGCNNSLGGDGLAFVLQPFAKLGNGGEGLGFGNLNPSIGIGFDTWQNSEFNDPPFDHISIQKDGLIKHGNDLAEPMSISATSDDVEDCNWHRFRVTWDPATRWLRTFFDNAPRVATRVDLIGDVFAGYPTVYWGFTGATGDAVNRQEFCTLTEPIFNVDLTNSTCVGDSLLFINNSRTFFPIREYYWDWGDGTASREKDPPPKVYTAPGVYTIKMSMTDVTGCVSIEDVRELSVGEKPNAMFEVKDVCFGEQPIVSAASNLYSRNIWMLNGNQVSAEGIPDLQSIAPGDYRIKYLVTSDVGCGSDEMETTFSVQKAIADAGRDSFVISNLPFQLNGFANGFIKWSPSAGLSNDNSPNPVAIINGPQEYYLEVTTTAGCTARDTVNFTVFKESAIYVPDAFSPNGDGRNDIFRPAYIGIKKLHYFSVYDRWGGQVFTTNNFGQGWNGVHKNSKGAIGTYVWIVSAENIDGKKIQRKGTVTLIR